MEPVLPLFLLVLCGVGLGLVLLVLGQIVNPRRSSRVKRMPYESGVDPFHDARRHVDVRFYLLAIAFLVFDVELLFLYPWAVASGPAPAHVPAAAVVASSTVETDSAPSKVADPSPTTTGARNVAPGIDAAVAAGTVESRHFVFGGTMVFVGLLALGLVYDWRKGVFQWR
ncbi:MAG TPA: NADH-quinone oxidoreductase subunit A [Thermoguttaceae bacterium]|nr:NADH-quinone oxidoreductase subunit A [Thermoguttaceae bacterium]